jgi:hypothetical protein
MQDFDGIAVEDADDGPGDTKQCLTAVVDAIPWVICYRVRPGMMSIMVASQMTRRIRNSSCDEGWVFMIYLPNGVTARYKRNAGLRAC